VRDKKPLKAISQLALAVSLVTHSGHSNHSRCCTTLSQLGGSHLAISWNLTSINFNCGSFSIQWRNVNSIFKL